jgi:hypothetical protein
MYNDQPDCPGVAGCAKHREQCPYFYSTPHGSAGFQNDWARIIRCGYDVGHDGPHFPGNSQGDVLPNLRASAAFAVPPQRANAEKEQPTKDSSEERECIIDKLDRIMGLLERISGLR